MLFLRLISEPDSPKPDYKRTVPKNIVPNVDVGASRTLSSSMPKHYIRQNIVNVVRQVPRLPKQSVQDDNRGHVINLENNGLVKKYTMKKVPKACNFVHLT